MSYYPSTNLTDVQCSKSFRVSPQRNLTVCEATRLVGTPLDVLDTNFWTTVLAASGTVAATGGQTVLDVPVTTGASAVLLSNRIARYVSTTSLAYRSIQRVDVVNVTNNSRFWGMTNAAIGTGSWTDGCGFLLVGGTLSVIAYNGATTGLIPTAGGTRTKVDSGSFNGNGGTTYVLDTNYHTFEVIYTSKMIYYYIDDVLIHTITATTAPLTGTHQFRTNSVTQNTGTITGTAQIQSQVTGVNRFGQLHTVPTSKYQSTVTGSIYKTGPGNLQRLVVGTVATSGAVVTLYDGTTTGGTVIASFTFIYPNGGNFNPVSIDLGGLSFSTGLYVDCTTQAAAMCVVYE